MKTFLTVVVILAAGAYLAYAYIQSNYQRQLAAITLVNVDLTNVADGTYTGAYKVFPVAAEVKVTVRDHKITAINIVKHENGKGTAAEAVIDRVVEKQTPKVDVVSGATASSKVILKAVELALKGGAR